MASIYGHRWLSSYGPTDADDTWLRGLADLTPAELAIGLRACVQFARTNALAGDVDWPPTLGEFRHRCHSSLPASHVEYVALPAPQMTEEEKQAAIARCRRALIGEAQ